MRAEARLIALICAVALGLSACSTEPNELSPAPTEDALDQSPGPAPAAQPGPNLTEYHEAVATCLQAAGWAVTASSQFVYAEVPLGQESAYEEAAGTCESDNVSLIPDGAPVDDALLRLNHERHEAAYNCLLDHGYSPDALPAFQSWVDQRSGDRPYRTYAGVDPDQVIAAMEVCPEPESVFVYPEIEIYAEQVDYAEYREAIDGSVTGR
ncbi:hypothetical protein [Agrococcus sp. Marseille-Q4369]|uniref:hypothetical protein n=1 Tax=Agrococcus sp. Marseille-Q4369 TaxID=2810513 RepID=UPI001B8B5A13|nr:hypothetical protein [Agrococcus sp. Marseille-Q4369]QUW18649.1 hypothetical protein JSQ78_12805 [Agrococcus sp. Marseille-Q4369]